MKVKRIKHLEECPGTPLIVSNDHLAHKKRDLVRARVCGAGRGQGGQGRLEGLSIAREGR